MSPLAQVAFDGLGIRPAAPGRVDVGLAGLLQHQVHLGQCGLGLDERPGRPVVAQADTLLQSMAFWGWLQVQEDLAQQDAQLEALRFLGDAFFEDLVTVEGCPFET